MQSAGSRSLIGFVWVLASTTPPLLTIRPDSKHPGESRPIVADDSVDKGWDVLVVTTDVVDERREELVDNLPQRRCGGVTDNMNFGPTERHARSARCKA